MYEDISLIPITSFELLLPRRTAKLLYFSDKDPQDISVGLVGGIHITIFDDHIETNKLSPDEPSTIFVKLPLKKPDDVTAVQSLGYYPTYAGLTPEQRWIYLNWLKNISEPIDIGYVFLYYYGLERHFLIGEFDLAIDELLYLRKHHNNHSFIYYSNSALLNSCIFRKRPDRLKDIKPLLETEELNNIHLLIAHNLGYELTAKNLIGLSRGLRKVNRRHIDKDSVLFEATLNERLIAKYGENRFPFSSKYKIGDLPKTPDILFANISFPSEIRSPNIPNFFAYGPFVDEARSLFKEVHENVKQALKEQRKRKNQP